MLAALVVAAACAAWHPEAAGHYVGTVESLGEKTIDTWIGVAPDGRLAGRYVLHEAGRDVSGTLEALGDDGCDTARFQWTDLYGTGVAQLHFYVARHCFEGSWGRAAANPALEWRSCTRERVTS